MQCTHLLFRLRRRFVPRYPARGEARLLGTKLPTGMPIVYSVRPATTAAKCDRAYSLQNVPQDTIKASPCPHTFSAAGLGDAFFIFSLLLGVAHCRTCALHGFLPLPNPGSLPKIVATSYGRIAKS